MIKHFTSKNKTTLHLISKDNYVVVTVSHYPDSHKYHINEKSQNISVKTEINESKIFNYIDYMLKTGYRIRFQ